MYHKRSGAESDEAILHTLLMDYCSPSQGSEQGNTVLFIKATMTKAISTFFAPNKGARKDHVTTMTDFMSGCGCGRAMLKSDGKPTIVALQEALTNSRQSDKFLENSPKEDSQSNGAPTNTCVFTTRYKTVHDGNKMLPLGRKIVWMMPKDNYRPNKLDPTHQIDVFAATVPQTRELVV